MAALFSMLFALGRNELLTIISAKCINPASKKRYPPTMIHKALQELKFSPVINKPAKLQALEAIKLLVSKQIIPIVRAKMKVKVAICEPYNQSELIEKVSRLIATSPTDLANPDLNPWTCVGLIDPVNYRDLMTLCDKKGTVQVLDMAVIDNTCLLYTSRCV